MTQSEKEERTEKRRAELERFGHYDSEDELQEPEDLVAWNDEYESRLDATPFSGRNAARDAAMLRTLLGLSRDAGTRVFAASTSYLVLKSGRYKQSVNHCILSLRLGGYLKKLRPIVLGEDTNPTKLELSCRYALIIDAFAPLPKNLQQTPQSVLKSLENGDFSHDAYAGRKGFSANRRKTWESLWKSGDSLTATALARVAGMNRRTVERSLAWLCVNGFAEELPNPHPKRNEGDVYAAREPESENAALEAVVALNELSGSTDRRIEYATSDFVEVKRRIAAQKRKTERRALLESRMRTRK